MNQKHHNQSHFIIICVVFLASLLLFLIPNIYAQTSDNSQAVSLVCTGSPCPFGSPVNTQALVWPTSMGPSTNHLGYTASAGIYLPDSMAAGVTITITSGTATIYASLPNQVNNRVLATLAAGQSYTVVGLASGEVVSTQSAASFAYTFSTPPPTPTVTSTPTATPLCTDPMTCDPVLSIPSYWRCNIPECVGADWQAAVIAWPEWSAYEDNARSGNNSRTVYSYQGEILYPYMGAWANGCEVTAVSGLVLIIEWERGTDVWRETYLNPGQSHTISLLSPEDGAMIETIEGTSPTVDFSVSLANCIPQTVTKTPTPTPSPTATVGPPVDFPSTGVLDDFNRADGPPGSDWAGSISGYGIEANKLEHIGTGEQDIYWSNASFGIEQEAHVILETIDPNDAEIGLILKSQNNSNYDQGLIDVIYNPGLEQVRVWTFQGSQGWLMHGASIPATFAAGDQFGARAQVNGQVEVYKNGSLLGTRNVATWPLYAQGGHIGLFSFDAGSVVFDDFGGGDVVYLPTATPTPLPTNTPTSTPTSTPLPTNTPTSTPTPTFLWQGSQDSDWNNSLNWTPNSVPDDLSNVMFDPANLSGVQAWPELDADLTVNNLSIAVGAELTILNGRSLTVNGTLSNNGLLRQIIDIQSASPTRFLYITGTGGAKYYGVDITPAGAMGPTTVEIRGNQFSGCNQNNELIHRCFDIAPTTPQSATVRFWYLENERNDNNSAAMNVYHWQNSSQIWERLDTDGELRGDDGGSYHYVEVDNVNAYSPFGLTEGGVSGPTAVSLQSMGVVDTDLVMLLLPVLFLFLLMLLTIRWALSRR